MSLGRDPRATVETAARDGFECMQIFASSPGAWKPPLVEPRRYEDFVLARGECGIDPLFIHAIYLINLASGDPLLRHRSERSLIATLGAGSLLRARGVVTHLGSHGGRGFPEVAETIAGGLKDVLAATPDDVLLVLENSSGAGGIVGAQLEELAEIIALSGGSPRLAVCLDTAHLCGAGWDLAAPGAAERLVADVERRIGLHRLALLHVNDSKAPCGSRRDRHANIGEGHIGLQGFRQIAAQPALRRVPWILETPVGDAEDRHVADLRNLRQLQELMEPLPLPDVRYGS